MELVWLVYAISLLDSIAPFLGVIIFCCIIGIPGLFIYCSTECTPESYNSDDRKAEKAQEYAKVSKNIDKVFVVLCVASLLQVFLPSKKTAYIMVGAYVTQKIAESGEVKEVGSKVYALINKQLDEYLAEEITEKKKSK